jgi:hypothetical protein
MGENDLAPLTVNGRVVEGRGGGDGAPSLRSELVGEIGALRAENATVALSAEHHEHAAEFGQRQTE